MTMIEIIIIKTKYIRWNERSQLKSIGVLRLIIYEQKKEKE